jgi:DNA gyrase subunit B
MELNFDYYRDVKGQFKLRAGSFEDSARWVKDEDLLDIHQKLAENPTGKLILDVCCGRGILDERLSRNGSIVVGSDISLTMLQKARQRLNFCVNGLTECLPFLDNVFDVVVCRQVFHFLDIKRVIKEMYRIAKSDGGKIIISQIVPFGEKDNNWLFQIHREKQPLLKDFLYEQDLNQLLKNVGCADITSYEHCIEEPINNWLKDTYFSQATISAIKKCF